MFVMMNEARLSVGLEGLSLSEASYQAALDFAKERLQGRSLNKERNETGYLKSQIWVSKEKMIPLQLKAWVTQGKRLKYTTMSEIKMVNGVWTAHKVFIKTKKGKVTESTSTLVTSDLVMNAKDVTDADFTEQRLERGL